MTEQEIRKVFESMNRTNRSLMNKDICGDYLSRNVQDLWVGFKIGFQLGRQSTSEPMGS